MGALRAGIGLKQVLCNSNLDSMDASSSELVEFVGNRDAGPAIQKLLPGKKSMLTNLAKLLGQLWGKVNWTLLNDGMNFN